MPLPDGLELKLLELEPRISIQKESLIHVESEHGSISGFFSLIHKSEFEEIEKNSSHCFHLSVSKFLPQTNTRTGLIGGWTGMNKTLERS